MDQCGLCVHPYTGHWEGDSVPASSRHREGSLTPKGSSGADTKGSSGAVTKGGKILSQPVANDTARLETMKLEDCLRHKTGRLGKVQKRFTQGQQ